MYTVSLSLLVYYSIISKKVDILIKTIILLKKMLTITWVHSASQNLFADGGTFLQFVKNAICEEE